mgnify:CR=1 FL=1
MGYIINGITKIITLTPGTTNISVRDLWSRWVDWFIQSDNGKFLPAFKSVGGDSIDIISGTFIPIYSFLENGWKIKPQESNHTLTVSDGILLVTGGGDPFTNTIGNFTVRINYQQPVQAISFASEPSSGINIEYENKINEIWKILGLDENQPWYVSETSRVVDSIVQNINNNGTEVVVTRLW